MELEKIENKSKISPEDMKLMLEGICPTCKQPMIKNGKRTHSLTKAKLCEAKFREKTGVSENNQTITVDGKEYEIDAKYVRNPKKM